MKQGCGKRRLCRSVFGGYRLLKREAWDGNGNSVLATAGSPAQVILCEFMLFLKGDFRGRMLK